MGDAEEEGFGDVTKHVTACESREGVAANGSGSRKQPPRAEAAEPGESASLADFELSRGV